MQHHFINVVDDDADCFRHPRRAVPFRTGPTVFADCPYSFEVAAAVVGFAAADGVPTGDGPNADPGAVAGAVEAALHRSLIMRKFHLFKTKIKKH